MWHDMTQCVMFSRGFHMCHIFAGLRRQITRYKNPQLVMQHWLLASFGSMFRVFHPAWSTCRTTNIFVVTLKKVVAKSRAWVHYEQQILHGFVARFSSNSQLVLDPHQANQPISAPYFFNPQQMLLLHDKLITWHEKRETLTQTLQRKNVAWQVEDFCTSYFAAKKRHVVHFWIFTSHPSYCWSSNLFSWSCRFHIPFKKFQSLADDKTGEKSDESLAYCEEQTNMF